MPATWRRLSGEPYTRTLQRGPTMTAMQEARKIHPVQGRSNSGATGGTTRGATLVGGDALKTLPALSAKPRLVFADPPAYSRTEGSPDAHD